jgi:hypothetical protein
MTAGIVKTFKQIRVRQVSAPCPALTGEVKHTRLDQTTRIGARDFRCARSEGRFVQSVELLNQQPTQFRKRANPSSGGGTVENG